MIYFQKVNRRYSTVPQLVAIIILVSIKFMLRPQNLLIDNILLWLFVAVGIWAAIKVTQKTPYSMAQRKLQHFNSFRKLLTGASRKYLEGEAAAVIADLCDLTETEVEDWIQLYPYKDFFEVLDDLCEEG